MGSRRIQILLAVAVAAVLAAVLVAVALSNGDDEGDAAGTGPVAGQEQVTEMLDGVPQQGTVLGDDDAPVTLVEYADIQCPHCATFAQDAFPHLVWDYVRDGQLRIEFRGLAFMGDDSERALRAALAAGEQGRLWHVTELLFYAQQAPNTGWVTDGLLRSIAGSVDGLDVDRMFSEMDSQAVDERMEQDAQAAQEAEVPGTPYFEIGRTGEELRPLEVQSLTADAFRPAIDELLER
jgi:protein-disulfide isomerase